MLACLITLALPAAPVAAPAGAEAAAPGKMLKVVNKVRARHGLHALRRSPSLMRSSRRFSRDLMRADRFGHRSRVSASSRFSDLGEVLYRGGARSIRAAVRGWLRSSSHRAILLTRSMRWVGTGYTRGRLTRGRATIWVLQVGSR